MTGITSQLDKFKKRRAGDMGDVNKTVDFLTLQIDDQLFGIPVLQVQDVLRQQRVTRVPLAAPEVAGALNLRGRIVTAINVRCRLGLPDLPAGTQTMSVVVEFESELYSLIIDRVGDVLPLDEDRMEVVPGTLNPTWREIANGIYRLDGRLLVIMDVAKLLQHSVH